MFQHKEFNLTLQALFVFAGKLIQIVFQFFVPIVLIRILSQSDYGIYQKILFYVGLMVPLLRFHFTDSLYYFFPISKNQNQRNQFISQTYFLLLFLCAFSSLITILILPFLENYFNDTLLVKYIYQILLIIFFTVCSSILENIFILEKKSKIVVLYSSIDKFLRTLLVISAILVYKTIDSALYALIIYVLIRFIFLSGYLIKNYCLSVFLLKINNIKLQLDYVIPMGIGLFVGVLGKNADKLILALLLTDIDFAIYSIGNLSIPFVATVYISIGNVVLPELSKYSLKNDLKRSLDLWKSMILKNAIVTIPLISFFIIQADEIFVILFTDLYVESANVFRVIILTLLIQMLGYGYILRAFGKTKKILIAKIYRTSLSLVVGYFLIKNFGIVGAAFTFLFSYSINAIIQLKHTKKLLNVSLINYLPWLDFIKLFSISLLPGIIIFFISSYDLPSIMLIILNGLIYFGLVIILLYKFDYLRKFGFYKIFKKNIFS